MSIKQDMTVNADSSGVVLIRDMLGVVMARAGFDRHQILQAQLALEEACTNIAMYAYPSGEGTIQASIEAAPGVLKIEIADQGTPFDVAGQRTCLPSGGLDQRPVGGMGIYLVKKLMDEVSYERRDGKNILRLTKIGSRR